MWKDISFGQGDCKNILSLLYCINLMPHKILFTYQVNWTQNVERCCSLGMHPISFSTAEEQTCFGNLSSNGKYTIPVRKYCNGLGLLYAGSWKGNLNYWTGGVQGCKGLFGWCAGADFSPLSGNISWASGQPELNKSQGHRNRASGAS
jgi:hypothetical protein